MINLKSEIASLKNDSPEYNRAIDDVLDLFQGILKTCKIVHTKSGLYFNGYDDGNYRASSKGKNTLSPNSFKSFNAYKKTDEEILNLAFEGHLKYNNEGKKLVRNNIVYKGSQIHEMLSPFYEEYDYLPVEDFHVEKK